MSKRFTNNKGFTLVEVIVVAVIVMILAAVAIPLYMGYVKDSRRAVADNIAGSVAQLLGTAVQTGATVQNTSTQATEKDEGFIEVKGNNPDAMFGGTATQVIIPKGFTAHSDGEKVYVKSFVDSEICATTTFARPAVSALVFDAAGKCTPPAAP